MEHGKRARTEGAGGIESRGLRIAHGLARELRVLARDVTRVAPAATVAEAGRDGHPERGRSKERPKSRDDGVSENDTDPILIRHGDGGNDDGGLRWRCDRPGFPERFHFLPQPSDLSTYY